MNVVLTLAVFASVLLAWVCLFNILPSCLEAMFRYRLAEQRDELALAVFRGDFQNPEPSERVVRKIEWFMENSSDVTVFRTLIARVVASTSRIPTPVAFDYGDMEPSEQQALESSLERFHITVANHALFETPSGWLFVILCLVLAPLILINLKIQRSDKTFGDELREPIAEGVRDLAPVKGAKLTPEMPLRIAA